MTVVGHQGQGSGLGGRSSTAAPRALSMAWSGLTGSGGSGSPASVGRRTGERLCEFSGGSGSPVSVGKRTGERLCEFPAGTTEGVYSEWDCEFLCFTAGAGTFLF